MEIEYQLTREDYLEASAALVRKSQMVARARRKGRFGGIVAWMCFLVLAIAIYFLLSGVPGVPARPIIPLAEKAAEAEVALPWVGLLLVLALLGYAQQRG